MVKRIVYVDETGKKRSRINDEWIKKRNEEKEKRTKENEKRNLNNYWLNQWLYIKKLKRQEKQEKFVDYLKETIPKGRWNEKLVRRFVAKIDIREESECWDWLAYVRKDNYGQIQYNGKPELSHRFVYILIHGEIPETMEVTHTCDNRRCVNPNHLKEDTHHGNMLSMSDRKRSTNQKYGIGTNAKLSWTEVNEIREKYKGGLVAVQLSDLYRVPLSTMYHIINNETWVDLDYQKWIDNKKARR